MAGMTLYFAPGTCARVALIALIEAGANFDTTVVRFMAGEHKSPAYRRINPKGKVPALLVDGAALTENVAILSYLHQRFPAAGLLPAAATPLAVAQQLADLCFVAATLHPIVTRIRLPQMFAAPDAVRSVWVKAGEAMRDYFQLVEDRLADQAWWYGDAWSVMDAYLHWVFWRVAGADFPVGDYPRFADQAHRSAARPSFARAMAIEAAATATLTAEGLVFTPPPPPP